MNGDDGFTTVVRGHNSRSRNKKKFVVKEKTADDYLSDLESKKHQVKSSKFMENLIDSFNEFQLSSINVTSIRCLALGQPSESAGSTMPAMYQLALLQLLQDYFEIESKKISFWDPLFNEIDNSILEKSGYTISKGLPTETELNSCLFYMPHAPLFLTNDILQLTTNSDNCFIIGNLLTSYDTRVPSQDLKEKYPYLNTTMKDMIEENSTWKFIQLPESLIKNEIYFQAFNDIAVHYRN